MKRSDKLPFSVWLIAFLAILHQDNNLLHAESIGPSSRRTHLVISEIMYHSVTPGDTKNLEFIEFYNAGPLAEDLSGYQLVGSGSEPIAYTFASGATLASQAYLVVAKAPGDITASYGVTNVVGPFSGRFPNAFGTLQLKNKAGAVLLEVPYQNDSPWPVLAAGTGHSLVLANPSFGERSSSAWAASYSVGGSPGTAEPASTDPLLNVVINEFKVTSNTNGNRFFSYVELYNKGTQSVDLSNCYLTDDSRFPSDSSSPYYYKIPLSTSIGSGQFLVFTNGQFGTNFGNFSRAVYLVNAARTRAVDGVKFGQRADQTPVGRYPDGAPTFHDLTVATPGAANTSSNSKLLVRDIIINEIMYNPMGGANLEYIELYNNGTGSVSVANWQLSDAVKFTFPSKTISAGGYLVVTRDQTALLSTYSNLTTNNTVGNYDGKLANSGGRIALYDQAGVLIDEVDYRDGGRWGQWADGGGSSLELINPNADNRISSNWADSDDTSKGAWVTVTYPAINPGTLRDGDGRATISNVEIIAQGSGEFLVDDVEVLVGTNPTNRAPNSHFTSNINSWQVQGSHEFSAYDTDPVGTSGRTDAGCLHVRASTRGDYYGNRVRATLSPTLPSSTTDVITLRAKMKWLKGHPEAVLRLEGNYLESVGSLTFTNSLGTPGAVNRKYATNTPPAIYDVGHAPIQPTALQNVTVTARVHDPDGLASRTLFYRVDNATNTTYTSATMVDNGTSGDAVSGDGVYSAQIPGQSSGTIVGFFVQAVDNAGLTNRFPTVKKMYPSETLARECLVRFGESAPSGGVASYYLLITSATETQWVNRGPFHNGGLDATFVYNGQRVIYNAQANYSGSICSSTGFNGPRGTTLCGYNLICPEDDKLLGETDCVLDRNAAGGLLQREQVGFWIARELGLPANHRRFMKMYVNGDRRGGTGAFFEDAQQPNSEVIEEWYPGNDDGDLFKIEVWWTVANGNEVTCGNYINAQVDEYEFPNSNNKNLARYRWIFQKRAVDGAANDYDNLFELCDGMDTGSGTYVDNVRQVADAEQWMRTFAVEHILTDTDSYSYFAGHNMYTYRPKGGLWQMLMYDMDYNFAQSGTTDLFDMGNVNDGRIRFMMANPTFKRAYFRAFQDAYNGPLATVNTRMTNLHNAIIAEGGNEMSLSSFVTFFNDRRTTISNLLNTANTTFSITPPTSPSSSNYVQLQGTAPINILTIRVQIGAGAEVEYPVTWENSAGTTNPIVWKSYVPLNNGTNVLVTRGYNNTGAVVGALTNTIVYNGATPAPDAAGNVVINEWMVNPATGEDWFELRNLTGTNINLSNYTLTDTLASPAKWKIPTNTVIAANGFLLFWADNLNQSTADTNGDFHTNFRLSAAREILALFAPSPDSRMIDYVFFGPQKNGVSEGRNPNGTGPGIIAMKPATPKAANNRAPTISLSNSKSGGIPTFTVTVTATASDSDGSVSKVEFYEGGILIATDTSSPFSFNHIVPSGTYVYTAIAYDNRGESTISSPMTLTVSGPPFLQITYPPHQAVFTEPGNIPFNVYTFDDRTITVVFMYMDQVQQSFLDSVPPYGTTFTNVQSGWHTLAAESNDDTGSDPSTSVQIYVNYPPTISSIPNQVILEDSSTGAINFMVNDQDNGANGLSLSASYTNPSLINSVSFGGSGTNRNITVTPVKRKTGVSTISVVVSDGLTTRTNSFTLTVNAKPAAWYVKADAATQGNWKNVYGADGYCVILDQTNFPSYVQVTLTNTASWLWPGTTSNTVRALQKATSLTDRIEACWHSQDYQANGYFTVDLNFTDNQTHQVAFYLEDWDYVPRRQRIEVSDSNTGAIIDTRAAYTFYNGRYLIWNLRGHVNLKFINLNYLNSVLSGIFFDTIPATHEDLVWVEDAVPSGASTSSDGGDSWNWITSAPTPLSGQYAHRSNIYPYEHQHFFLGASTKLLINPTDCLWTYVYLDTTNTPGQVMLQWNDEYWWDHRAYWGANYINYWGWGVDGTMTHRSMGSLPASGQWVALSVPAYSVGLGGRTIGGMAFTLYGGRATWDYAGRNGLTDGDSDGVPDTWEYQYFGNLNQSGASDYDSDGLSNFEELRYGSNPTSTDTDSDGILDGDEIRYYGANPGLTDSDSDQISDYDEVNTYGTDPANGDSDGDGLSDGDEILWYGTDPFNTDTDWDGYTDYEELYIYETDPLDSNSHP